MTVNVAKFIWKYLKKLKWLFFGTLVFRFGAELCMQQGIYYSSRIVGVISENGSKEILFRQALYLALLFALFSLMRGILHNATAFMEARFLPLFKIRMAKNLFNQAHKHSLQFFAEEMSGRVGAKVRQIIDETNALYNNGFNLSGSLIKLIITFCFIARVKFILVVYLTLFFALYIAFLKHFAKKLMKYSEESYNCSSTATGVLTDTMFNYSLVRNYWRIFFEKLNYFQKLHKWVGIEKLLYLKEADMYMLQGFLRALLQLIFLMLPLYYWLNGEMEIADFVLVESLITYLTLYCMDISGSTSRFFRNIGAIRDGLAFLYRPLQISDKPDAQKLRIRSARIRFQDLTFGYKNSYETNRDGQTGITPILFRHFNLDIKAGERVGLAGHSGSGKSSLIKLLCRYYDPSDGKITLNGHNISDITQDSLRQHISVIPQDPSLFNRTIMENIRYGNPKASDEEVTAAAKKAYIHDFIMRLPKGYHTKVGERGITLSGGERQRIAIARAVLKNAPILILDEATSALDSESEYYIQQALKDAMKGKTVVAIAHRLSTLREMDRLLVIDNGRIIEEGRHEELMKNKGAYYEFYQLQAASFRR